MADLTDPDGSMDIRFKSKVPKVITEKKAVAKKNGYDIIFLARLSLESNPK